MGPVQPGLEPAFTIEADIAAPRSAGIGPEGERLHIPITGGRVLGPKLTGRILPGGSDWPLITPDGNSRIEARYTIEAEDGTLIYVVNKGIRVSSDAMREKLRAGEPVAPDQFYTRAAPVFDAPDGPHRWLSERLFVCSLAPAGRTIVINVYCVT
ncbi:DUF3237 domain-containing protein [Sinisalibacter aestuarii]|uniref:UPF0311 protein STA1M1_03810 n=1 Tax=Sinisalibacter aestuarii TaxID=2949426 RepID=A0ABQ5LR17_9RHOB|nr:DUF3237 domain-containing protein [Sinisalibacter aestuarii]GKY86512.1 UPF0311 protein YveG [Sinisalibacter aestuarii]